jgi:hypothetical protein
MLNNLQSVLDESVYSKVLDWFEFPEDVFKQFIDKALNGDLTALAELMSCAFNAGEETKNLRDYEDNTDDTDDEGCSWGLHCSDCSWDDDDDEIEELDEDEEDIDEREHTERSY